MSKLTVLVFKPEEEPVVRDIDPSLESMQAVVGGWIEAIPIRNYPIALICNEEGKLDGLAWNRFLLNDAGEPEDILVGTFFLIGANPEDGAFSSLPDEYIEMFLDKEICARHFGKILDYPDVLLRLVARNI